MRNVLAALAAGLAVMAAGCASGQSVIGGCGAGSPVSGQPIQAIPACASPEAEMTPWPTTDEAAIRAANAFMGRSDYSLSVRERDTPVWVVRASDQAAVVNGVTGAVETIYPMGADLDGAGGAVPGWRPIPVAVEGSPTTPAITAEQALTAGRAFLGAHELRAGDGGSTRLDPAPGPVAWRVFVPDADGAASYELRVDATSGAVTAFLRTTEHLYIDLPRIDRDTAMRLAVAHAELLSGRSDLYPASVSSMIAFVDQTQRVVWSVGVNAPADRDGISPNINANLLEIDAVTGGIAVLK